MIKKFEGVLPALVTPLENDNVTVKKDAVKKIVDMHLDQGANGFYIIGGTGESIVLNREQREAMCEYCVEAVGGRKPIINHVAAVNMPEAIELAKHAEKVGCDAIAAIPPVFFKYSDDDLFNYYKKLADSVSIPVMIYYHPAAQSSMTADLIARIYEIDNVTGVKWSSNNYYEMMKLKDKTHGEMNIINGPDELLVSGLAAGADAGIGSTYNIMLPEFVKIYNCYKNGNMTEALATQIKVNRVIDLLIKNMLIPSVKYAVGLMGIDVGNATFPMKQNELGANIAFEQALYDLGWTPDGRVL